MSDERGSLSDEANLISEEIEEETAARMEVIQAGAEAEFEGLADLLDAELAYFTQCKEILEDLKESWPTGYASSP